MSDAGTTEEFQLGRWSMIFKRTCRIPDLSSIIPKTFQEPIEPPPLYKLGISQTQHALKPINQEPSGVCYSMIQVKPHRGNLNQRAKFSKDEVMVQFGASVNDMIKKVLSFIGFHQEISMMSDLSVTIDSDGINANIQFDYSKQEWDSSSQAA